MSNSVIKKKKRKVIISFLFFPIILLFLFGFLPIVSLIRYSFTSWNGIATVKEFVGFENYITVLTNPRYFEVFRNNLYYLVSGILQILVSMYFAVILSSKIRCKEFFKATFIVPTLISGIAIAMIFRMFFSPDGTFNYILTILGLEDHIRYWIGDPSCVNYTLASISLWRHTGISFIMYYGAIQSIPQEYYEVADIEGATSIQKFIFITLPNIRTVMKINFTLLIIGAISVFEIPMIMTNGSNGTMTFLLQTMKTSFEKKQVGLAASMAVIITCIIVLLTIVQKKISRNDLDE